MRDKITLSIDEIHTLVGAGKSEGAMDAANILKPALARGELRAIGATTLDEYRKYFEKDKALERRFQMVMVNEPDEMSSISILRGIKDSTRPTIGKTIKDDAILSCRTHSTLHDVHWSAQIRSTMMRSPDQYRKFIFTRNRDFKQNETKANQNREAIRRERRYQ